MRRRVQVCKLARRRVDVAARGGRLSDRAIREIARECGCAWCNLTLRNLAVSTKADAEAERRVRTIVRENARAERSTPKCRGCGCSARRPCLTRLRDGNGFAHCASVGLLGVGKRCSACVEGSERATNDDVIAFFALERLGPELFAKLVADGNLVAARPLLEASP
jgi:hypothetical protein